MRTTNWFQGSENPVYVGWYQVKGKYGFLDAHKGNIVMRFWTGKQWMWINKKGQLVRAAVGAHDFWRGLTKKWAILQGTFHV